MRVVSVNTNICNNSATCGTSVNVTRSTNKPSFGWLLSKKEATLLKKYLSPTRMAEFSQEMMKLSTLATQKTVKASDSRDEILKMAIKEAKKNRFNLKMESAKNIIFGFFSAKTENKVGLKELT